MATKSMRLEIVSAQASVFSGKVTSLIADGEAGELGIHAGHTPLLTPIKPGQLRAMIEGEKEERFFYVSGGMLEVQPEVVTVLADTAQRAEDLDEAAAMIAKEAAEKCLAEKAADLDYSLAMKELAESIAQLKAIRSLRDKRKH
jgi:F-type H+-transporting ATPase subunit epsilon